MARIPSCADGHEKRNAAWHLGFAILCVGSLIFHVASVVHHLREAKLKLKG